MLRSKSRSGYLEFGQKKHSSALIRSISGAKICRGDALVAQVDKDALVSIDRNPPYSISLSENRIVKAAMMQKQMGSLEEELKITKEMLDVAEGERNRAFVELRETKELANRATMKLNEGLSPKRADQVVAELKSVKDSLANSRKELDVKERDINFLSSQLEKAKVFELKLAEREATSDELNQELRKSKESEARATKSLLESKKRVQELEAEMEKVKLSESKMFESLTSQTRQLEQTKIELEESKLEIASLHEAMKKLQKSNNFDPKESRPKNEHGIDYSTLEKMKADLDRAQEGGKIASLRVKSLNDEMGLLKNELTLATEAEEKSKKAMDDLAMALKEVATEASMAKEKLKFTEVEKEHLQGETERLKEIVRTIEEKYRKELDEAKKEIELHKNTADRLRMEAEESLFAWNGKEMGFVSCIKRAEEETALTKHENSKLNEALIAAENSTRKAREECYKLRDILKQAINESNVAKEASSIARAENSELKDLLAEKEETLHFLTKENERLRINEVAAHENVKEFKRLLSARSDFGRCEEKEQQTDVFNSPVSSLHEEHIDGRTTPQRHFSFDLEQFKIFNKEEEPVVNEITIEEDPEKAEALKGSIFDPTASPKSEPQTPKPPLIHHRRDSSTFTDPGSVRSEECDHINSSSSSTHVDETTEDKSYNKKRLFRRIGDLIYIRRSTSKKELTPE